MRRISMRRIKTLAVLVLAGVVALGCSGSDHAPEKSTETTLDLAELAAASAGLQPSRDSTETVWRVVDDRLIGEWKRLPFSTGLVELDSAIVSIDDTRLVVVRTTNGGRYVVAYIFDSATEKVTPAAPSGAEWRPQSAVVWTGEQVLIVGGASPTISGPTLLAYDPDSDDWDEYALDALPTGTAVWGEGVWTGSEIIFGAAGLALDPSRGSWRTLAASPLAERISATETWTGRELIVWGGCDTSIGQCDDLGQGLFTDGAIYEPSSDTWWKMAQSPLPRGANPAAVWTGREVIYYPGLGDEAVAIAASYDPARDKWTALPAPPFSSRRGLGLAFSSDAGLLFAWGGSDPSGNPLNDGAALDISAMRWLQLPAAPSRTVRDRHAMEAVSETFYIDGGWPVQYPLILKPG